MFSSKWPRNGRVLAGSRRSLPPAGWVGELWEMRPSLVVCCIHPVLIICGETDTHAWSFDAKTVLKVCGCAEALTFLWRSDGDGLCCELFIKVARVRLGGDLRLERWNQLKRAGSRGALGAFSEDRTSGICRAEHRLSFDSQEPGLIPFRFSFDS